MAGLVPAIPSYRSTDAKTWMPGTRPGMTAPHDGVRGCHAATINPRALQYRCTICSSFRLSNQDRPRNATSMTMPRPEEALFMDVSEN